jgi:hypothetical protein
MSEVGLTPSEEVRVQQAADDAFLVLTGNENARTAATLHGYHPSSDA